MATACVLLANGFEEIEAITVIDVLRRAEVDTRIVGVDSTTVEGAHGITVEADCELAEVDEQVWDVVALPGGMPGSANLRDSAAVHAVLERQRERGHKIAAICAAPIALAAAGVIENRRVTSYPGFEGDLGEVEYCQDAVVVDDGIITSRGPATAMAFALAIVAALCGPQAAQTLADAMLVESP